MNIMQVERQSVGYEKRWIGLIFIGISLIVISLDNTVLNVALPSIARSLGASASDLQWILDGYVLVFAALLLTTGSFGDRIGRKKALQVGLVLFGIGSLGAALSTSTIALIVFRAFLGLAGATIMPATLSLITATFPAKERPQAIALWAAVYGLGVGIGPLIGGWLVERFSWSSVFFVNLPVIVIALIGGAIFLVDSKDEHALKVDLPGVILSIIGLFALVYGIIEAGNLGWTDSSVLIAFVVALILLTAFALWERYTPDAMLPIRFFRNMSFTGANLALVLITFGLFGSNFFLTQYLQTIHGFTSFEAGVQVLPSAIALTIMGVLSARIAARIGTRSSMALGIAISACGLYFMGNVFKADTSLEIIILGQILLGFGLGLAISPATNSVMGSLPVSKAGIGSAMNDTTRQLGGALGVAVLGTIMNTAYLSGIEPLRTTLPVDVFEKVASSVQGAHLAADSATLTSALSQQIIDTSNAAFLVGMSRALTLGALMMGLAAVFVLVALPRHIQRSGEPGQTDVELLTGEQVRVSPVGD